MKQKDREKERYLCDPVYFAEVMEVPLIVGKVLEANLAGEIAAVVPGVLLSVPTARLLGIDR